MTSSNRSISPWLWLGLPIAIIAAQIGAKAAGEEVYHKWMRGELGVTETLTVVFLVFAVYYAIRCFTLREHVRANLFGTFTLIMALGCLYFAGEEASWGQHWLGYATPEAIAQRNEQGEFNLHNDPVLEGLLDNLPRALLTLAAFVGGILAPLLWARNKPADFSSSSIFGWIWPTRICIPTSLVAVFVTLPSKAVEATGAQMPYLLDIAKGETKEFCLALFLMLYLMNLYRQLHKASGVTQPQPS
ncbi:hypothetical protein [Motiliproteus sp. SC1-56]|uniref:hypothetical protein n=1 Tax=Motiliproteus sp. SC1-56 TaxID=2799565 RepID=UPI001A8CFD09|nr:hypothetical protein [Motiliproteus sp. SC1-56]